MIGYLSGTASMFGDKLLITTGGIGYVVAAPPAVISQLVSSGNEHSSLFIYTHVKEDTLNLYGFASLQDRNLFELVLSVSGVGPSIALHLVSAGTESLVAAVQNADVTFFKSVPRVGKKLAQKIIIELGSKLGEFNSLELGPEYGLRSDLIDSLTQLGFSEQKVQTAIKSLDIDELGLEKALKQAIQLLSK